MGGAGADGVSVRDPGQTDLVGVQLGHYGASHVLCHLRHRHSLLRLLHTDATGVSLSRRGGQAEADAVPQEGQEAQVGRGEVQQD